MDPETTDPAAKGSEEVRPPIMTPEAYKYYTEDGEPHGRFPLRMYLPQYKLWALFDVLYKMAMLASGTPLEPLTKSELMLLVGHDGEQCKCVRCGDKFQPVKGVELRNLNDERVVKDIVLGKSRTAPVEIYGRMAPFISTFVQEDGTVKVMEFGSFMKMPKLEKLENGRIRTEGWKEPQPHCGPIYWWDRNLDRVVRNNRHCLGKAIIASDVANFGGNSYSHEAGLASIEYSEAKHKANVAQGKANAERGAEIDEATAEAFGLRIETSERGNRVYAKVRPGQTRPEPKTTVEDQRVNRGGKRQSQR